MAGIVSSTSIVPQITLAKEANPGKESVKNVIVMISDGWGYNQIAATDYYHHGWLGSQVYEKFPVHLGMSTYSVSAGSYESGKAWNDFEYIKNKPTDSAAAATAMSTGVKTYDTAIGVDANKKPAEHLSEYFEEQGKSTGVISSVEFSHATPAGFVAHHVDRNAYSEIANEMIKDSATDVIMGAGHPDYDDNGKLKTEKQYKYVGGEETWSGLVKGTLEVSDADGDGTPDPWTLQEENLLYSWIGLFKINRLPGTFQFPEGTWQPKLLYLLFHLYKTNDKIDKMIEYEIDLG